MDINEMSSILHSTSIKSDISDFITRNKKLRRRRHSSMKHHAHIAFTPFTPAKKRKSRSRLSKKDKFKIQQQLFSSSKSKSRNKCISHQRSSAKPHSQQKEDGKATNHVITYKNLNIIGTGSFSTVYKVLDIETNAIYALKQGKKRVTTQNVHSVLSESRILRKLKYHPHIIQYQCFWIDAVTSNVNQLFKYYAHGTLSDLIEHNDRFSDSQIFAVLLQITRGLAHIHNTNIIHFDIKPENICVDIDYTLKISDFGISVDIENTQHLSGNIAQSGDGRYISPEIIYQEHQNLEVEHLKNADVFALGCIITELLLDSMLPSHGEIFHYLRSNEIDWSFLYQHVEHADAWNSDGTQLLVFIKDAVSKMMYTNPKERISSNELLQVICNTFDGEIIENNSTAFKSLKLPPVAYNMRCSSHHTEQFAVDIVNINNYGCMNRKV